MGMIGRLVPIVGGTIRRAGRNSRFGRYTREFFVEQNRTASRSAEVVVPLVMEILEPRSVVDVGCGSGSWLAVFLNHGASEVIGVDSDAVPEDILEVPSAVLLRRDLNRPLALDRTFDLVVCLEVAEHLHPEAGDCLIESLTALGRFVLFSAAIPRQGGVAHVNEQWPEYWAQRFARHEYVAVDCLRRRVWNNPAVAFWYAQNLLLFVERAALQDQPRLAAEWELMGSSQLSIVHPRCYESRYSAVRRVFGRQRIAG